MNNEILFAIVCFLFAVSGCSTAPTYKVGYISEGVYQHSDGTTSYLENGKNYSSDGTICEQKWKEYICSKL